MMRRVLCVLVLAAVLGGCGFRSGAEKAVDKMLVALQTGKLGTAERCAVDGTLSFDGLSHSAKDFYKALFAALDYTVAEVQIDGESAVVKLTVTTVDMDLLMIAEGARLLDDALDGEKRDSKQFYEKLTEIIKSGEPASITTVVSVSAVETDDGWRVDVAGSPAFADAITGGMKELIDS